MVARADRMKTGLDALARQGCANPETAPGIQTGGGGSEKWRGRSSLCYGIVRFVFPPQPHDQALGFPHRFRRRSIDGLP